MRQNWVLDFEGSPFIEIPGKLKKVRKALSIWSKQVYGNIFLKVATPEDIIRVKEAQFGIQPSPANREELKVEEDLRIWLKAEEDYWQQKVGMKWL